MKKVFRLVFFKNHLLARLRDTVRTYRDKIARDRLNRSEGRSALIARFSRESESGRDFSRSGRQIFIYPSARGTAVRRRSYDRSV